MKRCGYLIAVVLVACGPEGESPPPPVADELFGEYDEATELVCACEVELEIHPTLEACRADYYPFFTPPMRACFEEVLAEFPGEGEARIECWREVVVHWNQCFDAAACDDVLAQSECDDAWAIELAQCPKFPFELDDALSTQCLGTGPQMPTECPDGTVINEAWLCDDYVDCDDGWDESQCNAP